MQSRLVATLLWTVFISGSLRASPQAPIRLDHDDSVTAAIELDQTLSHMLREVEAQLDRIIFRCQQLAQQVNTKIVAVPDKDTTLKALSKTLTFAHDLRYSAAQFHDENQLQKLIETHTTLLTQIKTAIDAGFESFEAVEESVVIHNTRKMHIEELQRILKHNDLILDELDENARTIGLSMIQRTALTADYFLKRMYTDKIARRGWPYLLLGHWWLIGASPASTSKFGRPLAAYKRFLDKNLAHFATRMSAPAPDGAEGESFPAGTESLAKIQSSLGITVSLDAKSLFTLGLGGVVVPRIKKDMKDLWDLMLKYHRIGMAKLKALPAPTDPIKPPKGSFSKLIGLTGAKEQIQPAISYLCDPDAFIRTGKKVHRGYLFIGPRYSGKRSLADAVAGEVTEKLKANQQFLKANGNNDTCKIYDIHASALLKKPLATVLEEAREATPCIVVINNIEWLDMKDQEKIGAIVQAITKYFKEKKEGIIIATTSDVNALNPALLETGRLTGKVYLDLPDYAERKKFVEKKLSENGLDPDQFALDTMALATNAQSFRALTTLLEQLFAYANVTQQPITPELFEKMVDREIYNISDHQVLSAAEINVLSAHLAGQAVVHLVKNPFAQLTKITILPVIDGSSRLFGKRFTYAEHHLTAVNYEELKKECTILLAGEVAQEMLLGASGTCPLTDAHKKARELALTITLQGADKNVLSKTKYNEFRDAAYALVETLKEEAHAILTEKEAGLKRIAQALKERQTLSIKDIQVLL